MTTKSVSAVPLTVAASFAVATAMTGCAADDDVVSADAMANEPIATTSQSWTVGNPGNTYFADVTANGTGCPPGSTSASISDDGSTFTVVFSEYETSVTRGQFIGVKDCQLAIKLHTPQGWSYSVGSFDYAGYAVMDRSGMSATQTASYYFQGDRLDASRGRTTMTGPYEGEYVYRDTIGVADLVWSPCGATRNLNVATRLVLRNNASRSGDGYVNLLSTDGRISLAFNLNWRRC